MWKIICAEGFPHSTRIIAPDGREVSGVCELHIRIAAGDSLARVELVVLAEVIEAGFADEAVTAKLKGAKE